MQNGYANQAKQYQEQAILTATPEELLILLYDGAIRFLNIAKKAMEKSEIERSHTYLIKAQNIILEFMGSLNMEIGGETARNLYRLYEYFYHRLIQANVKKDVKMVDEVLDHLRMLKATWEEAIKIAAAEKAQIAGSDIGHPVKI